MSIRAKIKTVFGLSNRRQTLQEQYPQYRIGRGTYGNLTVLNWNEGASLSVGNFTSIADGVKIFLGGGGTSLRLGHNLSVQRAMAFRFCYIGTSQNERRCYHR